MEHGFDLSIVLLLLLGAVVLVPLFERLRISPVLAYLVAGVLIGPFVLGFVRDVTTVAHVAEFGVIFLLFAIGLELSLARLYGMRHEVFGLGSLQVVLTGLAIGGVAHALGVTVEAAIIIGGGLAFSSTAMVMQLLSERGETNSRAGRGAFSILLLQDLAVVPLMALVPLLAAEGRDIGEALGLAAVKAVVALAAIFLVGRFLLKPVFRLVTANHNRELFVGTTLLIVLGASWGTGQMGLSLALGAFLAGLLLAETEYRHQVEADIAPFRGLFLGLFFMTVGMSIDFGLVWEHMLTVLLLVGGLLAAKFVIISTLCRLFGYPTGLSLHIGLLLAQGGEFAFVLFGLAMAVGVLPPAVGQVLIVVTGLSMVVTPLLAALGRRVADRLAPRDVSQKDEIAAAVQDLRNHVIVAGFGRVGQTVSRLLQQYHVPYVAVDMDREKVERGRGMGYHVYYGNAAQFDVLHAAGLDDARLLVLTLDNLEAAEHLVAQLHKRYPDLDILVRGRDREQSMHLREAGASVVIPEALEASLQLSSCALRHWGIPVETVEAALEEIRREDYASVVAVLAGRGESVPGKSPG